MKVFWLSKFTDEEPLPLYRCLLEPNNVYSKNVQETLPFDYVIITNPKSSNLIYILNSLYLKSLECTVLRLYMSDTIYFVLSNKDDTSLEINFNNSNFNAPSMIELSSTSAASNLLFDHYIIIIPGGSIIIKTNSPILNAELTVNYDVEPL